MENEMIKLNTFDKEFYESLPEKEKIGMNEKGKFCTIIYKNQRAGVVGFIPLKTSKKEGFIQIILLKKFRGKGIVKEAEEMLAKKYKLKKLYATIDDDNIISKMAHEKIGYEKLPNGRLNELKQRGFLKEYQSRFFKNY